MALDLDLDDETSRLLQTFGFDEATFARLRKRFTDGELGKEQNRITGTVEVPADGDVAPLPPPGEPERERLHALGLEAIRAGKVGIVVLAGGMATRFGGVVKANVEALDGHTFLELKIRDAAQLAAQTSGRVPVYLMTSFATHAEVERAAEAFAGDVPVDAFFQYISLRLTPDGDLFRDADGKPSAYAPGHGDLPFALQRAGLLRAFREAGGELLYMSNVDNLGATLEPAIVGHHLERGRPITCEVVDKLPGDKGGAPARVDGHLEIVESFRFPDGYDQDQIGVFNTNTFVLDAAALEGDFELTWFAVEKNVDDRPAIQFERLVGQLTAFLDTSFVRVARSGSDGRFQPAKDPAELERRRPEIHQLLRARGVLE